MALTLFCLLNVLCSIHISNSLFCLWDFVHFTEHWDYPKFIFVRYLLRIILRLCILGKNITEAMLYSSQWVLPEDTCCGYGSLLPKLSVCYNSKAAWRSIQRLPQLAQWNYWFSEDHRALLLIPCLLYLVGIALNIIAFLLFCFSERILIFYLWNFNLESGG